MRYYLDTEFNEFGGDLISLALTTMSGRELYLATECPKPGAWVAENVLPIVSVPGAEPVMVEADEFGPRVAAFLAGDPAPIIVADWPDDIRYFCGALIVGPGQMVSLGSIRFEMHRVDAYPTRMEGAVQHNALWDARALACCLIGAGS